MAVQFQFFKQTSVFKKFVDLIDFQALSNHCKSTILCKKMCEVFLHFFDNFDTKPLLTDSKKYFTLNFSEHHIHSQKKHTSRKSKKEN